MRCLVMTAVGLLSGAVLYSYLIPRLFFGKDVRLFSPDGNPGSTNAIRAVGVPVGAVCMALDVAKAFVPVFVSAAFVGVGGLYLVPVAVAPVIGHAFSPVLRFRGGKAVSTVFGSLLGLLMLTRFVVVVALALFFFRFVVTVRPDSTGVITGMVVCTAAALLLEPPPVKLIMAIMAAVVCIKHLLHPDPGKPSVQVGHYSVTYEDRHLVLSRI